MLESSGVLESSRIECSSRVELRHVTSHHTSNQAEGSLLELQACGLFTCCRALRADETRGQTRNQTRRAGGRLAKRMPFPTLLAGHGNRWRRSCNALPSKTLRNFSHIYVFMQYDVCMRMHACVHVPAQICTHPKVIVIDGWAAAALNVSLTAQEVAQLHCQQRSGD